MPRDCMSLTWVCLKTAHTAATICRHMRLTDIVAVDWHATRASCGYESEPIVGVASLTPGFHGDVMTNSTT